MRRTGTWDLFQVKLRTQRADRLLAAIGHHYFDQHASVLDQFPVSRGLLTGTPRLQARLDSVCAARASGRALLAFAQGKPPPALRRAERDQRKPPAPV